MEDAKGRVKALAADSNEGHPAVRRAQAMGDGGSVAVTMERQSILQPQRNDAVRAAGMTRERDGGHAIRGGQECARWREEGRGPEGWGRGWA
jgi:hypothetical protein